MADKTEVTVSVMPKVEEKIVELSGKLEQLMAERAPEAWETALAVVQVDATAGLIRGAVLFTIWAAGVAWFVRYAARCWRNAKDSGSGYNFESFAMSFTFGGGIGGSIFTVVFWLGGAWRIFNFWNYVALFRPELVIARRVLDGVL